MLTGAAVPVASGLLTGMLPLYPPYCLVMSAEMALASGLAATIYRLTRPRIWPALLAAIIFDRVTSIALTYALAGTFGLPPRVVSIASFAQGLPGIALQIAVIPLVMGRLSRRRGISFTITMNPSART